jgi:hypothetical protein
MGSCAVAISLFRGLAYEPFSDNSVDSRFICIEFIPAERLVGKVSLVWWNTDEPRRAGLVPR